MLTADYSTLFLSGLAANARAGDRQRHALMLTLKLCRLGDEPEIVLAGKYRFALYEYLRQNHYLHSLSGITHPSRNSCNSDLQSLLYRILILLIEA